MIWEELAESFATQSPVKGRFLNSIYGGYAIGVAGVVGLLPDQNCNKKSFRKIGSLQDFYVKELDFNTRTLILSDRDSWQRDQTRLHSGNRRCASPFLQANLGLSHGSADSQSINASADAFLSKFSVLCQRLRGNFFSLYTWIDQLLQCCDIILVCCSGQSQVHRCH